jgi:hypothetical protein
MNDPHPERTQLFTVRLWLEPIGGQQMEVRGKLCHVLTNETQYFRNFSGLAKLLGSYLHYGEKEEDEKEDDD